MYCEQCVFRSRKCARSLSSSLTGKKTDILRQLLKSKTAAARTRGLTSAKSAVSAALSGVRGCRSTSIYVCVCVCVCVQCACACIQKHSGKSHDAHTSGGCIVPSRRWWRLPVRRADKHSFSFA